MLQRHVGDECRRDVLSWSVVEDYCRDVLDKSQFCREVLQKTQPCREVLEKSQFVEKWVRRALQSSLVQPSAFTPNPLSMRRVAWFHAHQRERERERERERVRERERESEREGGRERERARNVWYRDVL